VVGAGFILRRVQGPRQSHGIVAQGAPRVAVGNTSLQMCGDSRYGQEWFSVQVFDHGGYEVGRYCNYLDAEATMLEWRGY
jgi:hypothetical protein